MDNYVDWHLSRRLDNGRNREIPLNNPFFIYFHVNIRARFTGAAKQARAGSGFGMWRHMARKDDSQVEQGREPLCLSSSQGRTPDHLIHYTGVEKRKGANSISNRGNNPRPSLRISSPSLFFTSNQATDKKSGKTCALKNKIMTSSIPAETSSGPVLVYGFLYALKFSI